MTIDDIVYVIDSGKHRETQFDARRVSDECLNGILTMKHTGITADDGARSTAVT